MMKIIMNTLLLIIAVFLYFGELKGFGSERESTSNRPRNVRGKNIDPNGPNPVRPADRIIPYRHHNISLWLQIEGTWIIVLKADFPGNHIPHGNDYRLTNFITRLVELEGIKVVEYLNMDGSLMGVRARRTIPRRVIPYGLQPDKATWFITYSAKHFRVRDDPDTGYPLEMNLLPENSPEVTRNRHLLTSEEITIGNFKFMLLKQPNGRIVGAELHPEIQG